MEDQEFSQDDYQERRFGKTDVGAHLGVSSSLKLAREIAKGGVVRAAALLAELAKQSPRTRLRKALQDSAGLDKRNIPKR